MEPLLFVSGMHLSPEFGNTVTFIEEDGFVINEKIPMLVSGDTDQDIAISIGLGVIGLAHCFSRTRPDILLLVGDRYELLSAVSVAVTFNIPIGHISGGDNTEGAIDNQIRNAVTKLSHLHFVSMKEHAERVLGMGEEPWRVTVTGDPALDELKSMNLIDRKQLEKIIGLELKPPLIVVTYHPTTLGQFDPTYEIDCLMKALASIKATIIITYPNADPGSHAIIDRIKDLCILNKKMKFIQSLGQQNYYSLLRQADAIVGNSSSGIWEAPSFELPAVNIGDRQLGRLRAQNVIDVAVDAEEIFEGIRRAISKEFRDQLKGLINPYGDGHACERIIDVLSKIDKPSDLLEKKFYS